MFCPACGHQNPEGARFCGNCGAALPSGPTATGGGQGLGQPGQAFRRQDQGIHWPQDSQHQDQSFQQPGRAFQQRAQEFGGQGQAVPQPGQEVHWQGQAVPQPDRGEEPPIRPEVAAALLGEAEDEGRLAAPVPPPHERLLRITIGLAGVLLVAFLFVPALKYKGHWMLTWTLLEYEGIPTDLKFLVVWGFLGGLVALLAALLPWFSLPIRWLIALVVGVVPLYTLSLRVVGTVGDSRAAAHWAIVTSVFLASDVLAWSYDPDNPKRRTFVAVPMVLQLAWYVLAVVNKEPLLMHVWYLARSGGPLAPLGWYFLGYILVVLASAVVFVPQNPDASPGPAGILARILFYLHSAFFGGAAVVMGILVVREDPDKLFPILFTIPTTLILYSLLAASGIAGLKLRRVEAAYE